MRCTVQIDCITKSKPAHPGEVIIPAREDAEDKGWHFTRTDNYSFKIHQDFDLSDKYRMISPPLGRVYDTFFNPPYGSKVVGLAIDFKDSLLPRGVSHVKNTELFWDGRVSNIYPPIYCDYSKRLVTLSMRMPKGFKKPERELFWDTCQKLFRTLTITAQIKKFEAAVESGNSGRITRMQRRLYETAGDIFPIE